MQSQSHPRSGTTTAAAIVNDPTTNAGNWGAVYALALCTFTLIASEFMPISLLSPIAATLDLTEGQAGQAIAISGIFAVATSLFITNIAGRIDRRRVLLTLTALLIFSGALVAFAPNYFVLMLGRALVGIAVGGFWSMSAATIMRLVPERSVPKGLAILNGGGALATTLGAPLGSFLGGLIGWRGAFFVVVPVAVAAVVWQALSLPAMPVAAERKGDSVFGLLRRPAVVAGMVAVALLFTGQYALYTYLRPFLEQVTQVSVNTLSAMLLLIGVAGFVGTILIGRFVDDRLHVTLAVMPAIMAALALGLAVLGSSTAFTAVLLALWGLVATAAPVAWWTWVARTAPDSAEAGGGLMVAVVQLAITLGATVGGFVYDAAGPAPEFVGSAGILIVAALAALFAGLKYVRPAALARAA